MKILVTGGTGRVGSEVIKELVKRKASVRALVRKQDASTKMPEGVEVVQGDLLDPVSVRKALDVPAPCVSQQLRGQVQPATVRRSSLWFLPVFDSRLAVISESVRYWTFSAWRIPLLLPR
jgi:hypothetical protein